MHSSLLCPSCPDAHHGPPDSTLNTPRLQTRSTLGRGGAWLSGWCQEVQDGPGTSEHQCRGHNVLLVCHSEPTTGERSRLLPPSASSHPSFCPPILIYHFGPVWKQNSVVIEDHKAGLGKGWGMECWTQIQGNPVTLCLRSETQSLKTVICHFACSGLVPWRQPPEWKIIFPILL